MLDQLIIGTTRSYDDYEASVKERKITDGKKKIIRDSVPFSNVVHDFSKMNGELYWEEKTLQYTFEITADSPEELATKITPFKSWLMNTMAEELHDPYIQGYHFLATFSDISVDDSEMEKATITATFTAYPYMIANVAKIFTFNLTAGEAIQASLSNLSSHRIVPTINSTVDFHMTVGDSTYGVPSGVTTDENFHLEVGIVEIVLSAQTDGVVTISFHEEVF